MSKKAIWWLVLLSTVIAAGAFAAIKMRDRGPRALTVEAESVERMRIVQTVTATGRIQPRTQVKISADVSGKITLLPVEEGRWVEKGALLVELDRERPAASVESSQASLRVARANATVARENMIKAQKDFVRARDLRAEGLETQAGLDAAAAMHEAEKARHDAAQDQVDQSRASLKQTEHDLSKTRITAPMAGTVSRLNKEVGEIALGSQFQEDIILVLSNLSGMEAEVQVDENDIVGVALEDRATIEVDALPDVILEGLVTEIANTADISAEGTTDQKTEFVVKIAISSPAAQLRPGMTATADIVTDVRDGALGIPIQAVAVRTPEQLGDEDEREWKVDREGFVEIVFVVAGPKVGARQISTGIQSESHIEILDGLSEGDRIVVGDYRAISRDLKDGTLVTVGETDPAVPVG